MAKMAITRTSGDEWCRAACMYTTEYIFRYTRASSPGQTPRLVKPPGLMYIVIKNYYFIKSFEYIAVRCEWGDLNKNHSFFNIFLVIVFSCLMCQLYF